MLLSDEEIRNIHFGKQATPNRRYYDNRGNVYLGTSDRRLRLIQEARDSRFERTESPIDDLQRATKEIVTNETIISGEYGDERRSVTYNVDKFGRLIESKEQLIQIPTEQVTDQWTKFFLFMGA